RGQCFVPVERIGLDHLLKERQLIRSTQQEFGQDPNLPALLFAGVIIEGAVIAYESNLRSGGAGARYLGVGVSTEYRTDRVSVALRLKRHHFQLPGEQQSVPLYRAKRKPLGGRDRHGL
ncbi:MAG: hypothetical protein O2811_02910, partial [Proteobacteria bacterium]|nr:hypothetical protein [Pseudomonadota bacterium]